MVISAEPDVFLPAAGAWGRGGWTRMVLAKAELRGLRELVEEAYDLVAPKRLVESRRGSTSQRAAATKSPARPSRAKAKKAARKR